MSLTLSFLPKFPSPKSKIPKTKSNYTSPRTEIDWRKALRSQITDQIDWTNYTLLQLLDHIQITYIAVIAEELSSEHQSPQALSFLLIVLLDLKIIYNNLNWYLKSEVWRGSLICGTKSVQSRG
ncbi:hypothetical protein GIB67_012344 [Kingdonia uniflora]|uniref:Uncharacterized protein n=1 Tax=Kingdonia uniflora TaxID=39325 RepID=A0A7J7MVT0_9MAGN|nr:hypothetical protein GIB67_012344 [Kingdonia uniflora]